ALSGFRTPLRITPAPAGFAERIAASAPSDQPVAPVAAASYAAWNPEASHRAASWQPQAAQPSLAIRGRSAAARNQRVTAAGEPLESATGAVEQPTTM